MQITKILRDIKISCFDIFDMSFELDVAAVAEYIRGRSRYFRAKTILNLIFPFSQEENHLCNTCRDAIKSKSIF